MYVRTDRQSFIDNFHKLDMVTAPCDTRFFGKNKRYCEHVLMTRDGKLLGKEISDSHGIKKTEYYKIA